MKQNDHDPNEIIRRYVVVRREDYNDFIFRTAQKHRFVSQALRAAETDSQYEFAAVVRVRFDVCWSTDDYANPGWLEKYDGDPRLEWALRELAKWVKEGDGAPECVTTLRKERER